MSEVPNPSSTRMSLWDMRFGPSEPTPEEFRRRVERITKILFQAQEKTTMTVRAKLTLTSIKHHMWSPDAKTLEFSCVYDTSIPEDQRFQKATPSGSIQMQVDNPAAIAQFELGKAYYVDFTPAA